MKKKQNKCPRCKAVKRCVFKIQKSGKQEMLQTRTLLSEQVLQIMLNDGLERPCPLNVRVHLRTFNATKPIHSSQIFENTTVHWNVKDGDVFKNYKSNI